MTAMASILYDFSQEYFQETRTVTEDAETTLTV